MSRTFVDTAVFMDAKFLHEYCGSIAPAWDSQERKHVLGRRQGSAENAAVAPTWLQETLTVVYLGLTSALQRTLRSNNAIGNLDGSVVCTAVLDAEQGFRRQCEACGKRLG